MPLTDKQQKFVAEYLVDLNATQAAIRSGYSVKTAEKIGSENLRKPEIAAAIASGKAKQLEAANVKAVHVLEELRRLSFADLADMVDATTGKLKPLHEMPPAARAAIASVKLTKKNLTAGYGVMEDVVELKLWDKPRALEMLAKHFGLLTEKLEHSGEITIRHEIPE